MREIPMWRRYLRFLGANPKADVEDELAFHLSMRVDDLKKKGLSEKEARVRAEREFGDVEAIRREVNRAAENRSRRESRADRLASLGRNARLGLRRIRNEPLFATAVILTFALGIGANAMIFGLLDRLLLSPPPHIVDHENVRRIVISNFDPTTGATFPLVNLPYGDIVDMSRANGFVSMAAIWNHSLTIGRGMDAATVNVDLVTASFFPLLGVQPELGRFFGPAEDEEGQPGVAVIGFGEWKRRYGGDPSVIGTTIDFGQGPYTIIGVAPRGFTGIDLRPIAFWLPLNGAGRTLDMDCAFETRGCVAFAAVARLKTGYSIENAETEATAALHRGRAEALESGDSVGYEHGMGLNPDTKIAAIPLLMSRAPYARLPDTQPLIGFWLGIVSILVLLIACANIANLIMTRALKQQAETGVRLALGSSRTRIISQVLFETLFLALVGGLVALLITRVGGPPLWSRILPQISWDSPESEFRVGLITVTLALFSGVFAAVLPALHSARSNVVEVLKAGGNRSRSAPRVRNLLVVLQVSMCLLLLIGAGLFTRSLLRFTSRDLGLELDDVFIVKPQFDLDAPEPLRANAYSGALERISSLPGVDAVSPDVTEPFGGGWGLGPLSDSPADTLIDRHVITWFHPVTESYFRALDLDLRRGRQFTAAEAVTRVALVDESVAGALWPKKDPLGECIHLSPGAPCFEVVGVVENIGGEASPQSHNVYVPFAAQGRARVPEMLLVRSNAERPVSVESLRRAVLDVDPQIRAVEVRSLRPIADWQDSRYLGTALFGAFGVLALLVGSLGLYSVVAFGVTQRTFELGMRAALGATPGRVLASIIGQGLVLTVSGVFVGLMIAMAVAPQVEQMVFEISPRDPLVLVGVSGILILAGIAASAVPALRALRVNPSVSIRAE